MVKGGTTYTTIAGETGSTHYVQMGDTGLVLAATATNGVGTSPMSSPTTKVLTVDGVTKASANDFLNSIGVNINWCYFQQSNVAAWCQSALQNLGVRVLRGVAPDTGSSTLNGELITMAQNIGAKLLTATDSGFGCSGNNYTMANLTGLADQAATAGALLGVEGPNEPDGWPVCWPLGGSGTTSGEGAENGISWLGVADLQDSLYKAVRADSTIANYPVFTITHNGNETDNVGLQFIAIPSGYSLSAPPSPLPSGWYAMTPGTTVFGDFANMHNYVICNGCTNVPIDNQAWNNASSWPKLASSTEPFSDDYVTTWHQGYTGYSTTQAPIVPKATTETGWWQDTSQAQSIGAKIILNSLLSQFLRGYKYTIIYQIADDPNGANNSFGFYTYNGASAKQSAIDVHNLTTILSDNPTSATALGTMNYTITGIPNDWKGNPLIHSLLLQKSNGYFELAVWDERCASGSSIQSGFNSGMCTQPTPTDTITVNLGGTFASVKTYDPTVGTSPVSPCTSCTNTGSVTLQMTDHPIIIEAHN
jgi:hypothetical protein